MDIAMKLSRMLGTTVNYWLNLQNAYDVLIAEFKSQKELEAERKIFEYFDYRFSGKISGCQIYQERKMNK